MTINELLALTLSFGAGAGIGLAFFSSLWWTVSKGIHAQRPAALFAASFVARFALALIGFYAVGAAHPDRMAACLLGFVFGRLLVRRGIQRHQRARLTPCTGPNRKDLNRRRNDAPEP